jgi:hypothetical protein
VRLNCKSVHPGSIPGEASNEIKYLARTSSSQSPPLAEKPLLLGDEPRFGRH